MKNINLLLNRFLTPVDNILDKFTSYKLVLYFLYVVFGWSILLSLLGQISFKWYDIVLSAAVLAATCYIVNTLISKKLNIPKNKESDLITALILTLILTPSHKPDALALLALAGTVAMVSKYLLVINKWHIFNPAAFGAFISGFALHHYASWWVGTKYIVLLIFIGGMLVLRKMKRFIMVIIFELTALAAIALQTYLNQSGAAIWHNLWTVIISTGMLFFAYIMLTEPFTSPRHLSNYLPYAILVGFLYGYSKFGITTEEALLVGNVFAYIIEPNRRLPLKFVHKITEAAGIESFVFSGKNNFKYTAGQYMEWTLSQHDSDFRGNRRYLTISSSPTEQDLMFSVKLPPEKPSAFKSRIEGFKKGDVILADGLAGDFGLPKSEKQKLAFLAGGVGITPFRSMVKYAIDFGHQRDIHILYSAVYEDEFAFKKLFSEAEKFGVRTTYITDKIDQAKIKATITDFAERIFYISGPYGFVHAMQDNLLKLGVQPKQIKTDYFPGYSD
jgi:ferredoxin-NADP reductase/Na+-translocating ferredoxin:NAD+ oxidoreductase RnfD subunit